MKLSLRSITGKSPAITTSRTSQSDSSSSPEAGNPVTGQDAATLEQLGYNQELKREWSLLHNFGVSFSIISMITGITTLMEYGLTTGGPGVVSCGWLVVCFFTFFVGLGMAEITSAIPTSGGKCLSDLVVFLCSSKRAEGVEAISWRTKSVV